MDEMRWNVFEPDAVETARAVCLAGELKLPVEIGQLLRNRGIKEVGPALRFLEPSLRELYAPESMAGMEKAAARIVQAIRSNERIIVYGDYDVDGVTATTIMYHALRHFGASVDTYIPHRINEGYGINQPTAEKIANAFRPGLVITVDCGITGVEAGLVFKREGIDFIVTDHHEWKDELPEAYALVHPRLPREDGGVYPNPALCGAGVSFKLAWAVGKNMSGEDKVQGKFGDLLQELLCFAAMGTIADVVPLLDENRVLAVHGLQRLPGAGNEGIRALLGSARLSDSVDGYAVGFSLAPRLNAAGRMGHAKDALRMFTRADRAEAEQIAKELEKKNKARQDEQKKIAAEAIELAKEYKDDYGIIVCGRDWHPGIVGIVASRLVETFRRPAIVLAGHGDDIGGSCRSIDGFNIAAALKHCGEHLKTYGGHAAAAGCHLPRANLDAFRAAFKAYCAANIDPASFKPELDLDMPIAIGDLSPAFVHAMKRMGPFGQGNKRPLFCVRGVLVADAKTMGNEDKHLMFIAHQGRHKMKCVMWNQGPLITKLPNASLVDLAVEPTINEWRGRENVELLVRDIRTHIPLA